MFEVSTIEETRISEIQARQIAELASRSFGKSGRTIDERVAAMLEAREKSDLETSTGRRFLLYDGSSLVAHARTFVREVIVGKQAIPVLALATVCSDPDRRGKGLGVAVTQAAFQLVGESGWPLVSLFQTPVPGFYEKLACRLIENRFVNRLNAEDPEASPWRDDKVMIYPAAFPWPEGVVDLNGPDY